jgi:signal transduction histidine kinase
MTAVSCPSGADRVTASAALKSATLPVFATLTAAIAFSIALLVFAANAASASDTATSEGVLIIHTNQRPTPATVIIEDALRKVVNNASPRPIEIYSEYLDAERFAVEDYAAAQAEFLATKYGDRNIRVIVAAATQALEFATIFHNRIPTKPPVVYLAIPMDLLDLTVLPPEVVGSTVDLDPTATLELAIRLQPNAKRLVIVLGAAARDRIWEQRVRDAVKRLEGRIEAEYLIGLPTTDLLQRLRVLPMDAIVYTPGYFVDGAGLVGSPRQSLELIAPASAAPVYGPLDTFLGTGIVGGYMAPYEDQAMQAGAIVVRLLNGASPTEIVPSSVPNRPLVDWRQIRRWGINERLLPADTVVKFREPTLWEAHRSEVEIGMIVILAQAMLIVALLLERGRRRIAEAEAQKRYSEMAHMNRRVAMGELSASIAHELNQPLGAIHNNAGAAEMLINANPPRLQEVAEILADIKRDDQRASDVIARIRRMLRKTEFEVQDMDLNETIDDTMKMLLAELSAKGMSLKSELDPGLARVKADRVEFQQVILNLVLNAVDAMRDQPADKRVLTIQSRRANSKEAEVSVIDSGLGIAAKSIGTIFDPFVTTKPGGMGLGLAISRTIVEANGGRIRAENRPEGGAVIHFTLPLAPGQRT